MASDINRVILVGRLTRDCESKQVANSPLCTFSIAVNRRTNQGGTWKDEPSYFDIELWGTIGESLKTYLTKGKQVVVEGSLRQNRWESQDGQKHSRVIISASAIQLLGSRGEAGTSNSTSTNNHSYNNYQQNSNSDQGSSLRSNNDEAGTSDFQDDIPF